MKDGEIVLSEYGKYKKALGNVNRFYATILIICGLMVAGGIAFAVLSDVLIGLIVCIAGVVLYTALTSNMLYKLFGMAYRSSTGQMTVTELYGKDRREVWIPRRVMLLNVTEIGDEAFDHASSEKIEVVHLPDTLRTIGKDAFKRCNSLRTICFGGSEAEWSEIECESELSAYEIIFGDSEEAWERAEAERAENTENTEMTEESMTKEEAIAEEEGE